MRWLAAILALCLPAAALADTPWTVVQSFPHDRRAFTEGLLFHDGLIYESTGWVGRSSVRAVRLSDGRVVRQARVEPPYFGEGLARIGDRLFSLTWQHGQGFVWDAATLRRIGGFRYAGEGWGMASDGARLVMSDGSHVLRFLDPATLRETGRIAVTDGGRPVTMLNELEFVDGEIFANVWMTPRIARIDPATGRVVDWIDLAPLVKRARAKGPDAVLNGIAWDAAARRLFVTGKNWPRLYEIRLAK